MLRKKTREQILEGFTDQLKGLVNGLLEKRELYLAEHLTKGNSTCTRDLLIRVSPGSPEWWRKR